MAQASPEELKLCYLLLHLHTWQILTPGWVNIPGLTSMLSSAKSELLRNEKDERETCSASLNFMPWFWPVADGNFLRALQLHSLCWWSLSWFIEDSVGAAWQAVIVVRSTLGRTWPSVEQESELLWLRCGWSRGGICGGPSEICQAASCYWVM